MLPEVLDEEGIDDAGDRHLTASDVEPQAAPALIGDLAEDLDRGVKCVGDADGTHIDRVLGMVCDGRDPLWVLMRSTEADALRPARDTPPLRSPVREEFSDVSQDRCCRPPLTSRIGGEVGRRQVAGPLKDGLDQRSQFAGVFVRALTLAQRSR